MLPASGVKVFIFRPAFNSGSLMRSETVYLSVCLTANVCGSGEGGGGGGEEGEERGEKGDRKEVARGSGREPFKVTSSIIIDKFHWK